MATRRLKVGTVLGALLLGTGVVLPVMSATGDQNAAEQPSRDGAKAAQTDLVPFPHIEGSIVTYQFLTSSTTDDSVTVPGEVLVHTIALHVSSQPSVDPFTGTYRLDLDGAGVHIFEITESGTEVYNFDPPLVVDDDDRVFYEFDDGTAAFSQLTLHGRRPSTTLSVN